jgi:hypothetical protein
MGQQPEVGRIDELTAREQELDRQLASGERRRFTSRESLRVYLEQRFPKRQP